MPYVQMGEKCVGNVVWCVWGGVGQWPPKKAMNKENSRRYAGGGGYAQENRWGACVCVCVV